MNDNVTINNKNIANYIMFKLDKTTNSFSTDELCQITELVIDYNNENESNFVFLNELLKLTELKKLTLRHGYIYNSDYNVLLRLTNLSSLTFDNCELENANLIASLNLKSLSLINCQIRDYSFINILKDLEELTIINGNIEVSKINTLQNLNYLQLSYSTILDNVSLTIESLKELYIDNTNIMNLDFLTNLKNLHRLSIDKNKYNKNRYILSTLNKDILVLNENMTEFVGDNDED